MSANSSGDSINRALKNLFMGRMFWNIMGVIKIAFKVIRLDFMVSSRKLFFLKGRKKGSGSNSL